MAETSQETVNKFFAAWFASQLGRGDGRPTATSCSTKAILLIAGAAERMGPPVAGVFKINGDKIATWRDYFDLAMATKQ